MKTTDPLGKALKDYSIGNKSKKIIVKSSISEDEAVSIDYFFRPEELMPAIEQKALQLCQGKVLDAGAAAGRHSVILQKRGFEVWPIDISAGAVEVMKSRGLLNARQADYFKLENKKYDTLLFMMNGVGICGHLEKLDQFFIKAGELLNQGGQIMQYDGVEGPFFYWLYVDFDTLSTYADRNGFSCEMILEGPHYEFLARLRRGV
ncbi:MAG: SAM-dependent methyltransferase [Bacteroidetes bacterium 4572_114]|nr:MAG: SAM-dependent methyltransferase [Bacteroidetes bacterium 4572_114]